MGRWQAGPPGSPGCGPGAEVGPGGAARVVEAIDYDFGSRQRHGIYRDIPGLAAGDPVQVASPTAPAQLQVTGTSQQAHLRIGDPDRTVSGRHRYTLGYRLAGVAPGGRLAWDAVGTSWTVPIGEVEVHVVAPWRLEGVRCVQGAPGSQAGCRVAQPEPGHLVATAADLGAGEGVTVYATAGAQLAAALAGASLTSRLVRRAGRERVAPGGATQAAFRATGPETRVDAADLVGLATVEFVPPRELTPAQGGVLLAEAVRPAHKVAWLIGAAVDGYLDLEGDDGKVTLVRLPRRDGPAAYLLDSAFAGRERLTLGTYDEGFAAAWRSLGRELGAWERAGLAGPGGGRRAPGRGGRGRARLGAAGPHPGGVGPVAADRVVPAVPGRLLDGQGRPGRRPLSPAGPGPRGRNVRVQRAAVLQRLGGWRRWRGGGSW